MSNEINETLSTSIDKYEIETMNGKDEVVTLYDKELITHTSRINQFRQAGNMAIINIAYELGEIDKSECYKKAGFKNTAEYASTIFDYKRPTTALYIRVAKAFLKYSDTERRATINSDILPTLTVGQMIELLPMVGKDGSLEEIEKAFMNGDLNQRMSSKKLRQTVKALTAIESTATEADEIKPKDSDAPKDTKTENVTPKEYTTNLCDTIEDCVNKIVGMSKDIELSEIDLNKLSELINTITEIRATINK